ncbi:hypothetical protein KQ51_00632 [Candidatus Izimaplasma bacterium HR1]|jgi:hypothetical protein|uniref:hypothetical protein n=1 Tax=Candidatus Izimoplasma sp. HR1 TaxID=1541959 RepID=UPI0004F8E7E4|nr:hypothetical protein KQ51_00632 [Candidatus Izimaplasma bacterium HR1]
MLTTVLSFIVSMSVYILFLFLFLEYTREKQSFYKWFFILALATLPLWFYNLDSWFRWAKSFSVLIPICFVSFVRISNDGSHKDVMMSLKKKWPLWILYLVLNLNILEATMHDFEVGNIFNAICGLILCITIPLPTKHWRIGKNDGKNSFAELIADLPLAWCLLYVTWNAAFVYGENTTFVASSICILIAPEIWMLVKRRTDLWLMGRIYTLAIHILIRASYDIFTPLMDSTLWFNESVLYYWGLVNLILHGGYLIYWALKLMNKPYVIKHSAEAYGY